MGVNKVVWCGLDVVWGGLEVVWGGLGVLGWFGVFPRTAPRAVNKTKVQKFTDKNLLSA